MMENIVEEFMDETIAHIPPPTAPPIPPPTAPPNTPIAPPIPPPTAPPNTPSPTSSEGSSKVLKIPAKRKRANAAPRQGTDEGNYGSEVWAHFVKYGSPIRAKCKYCNADYAADPKSNGTSNLHKHIRSCGVFQRLLNQQRNQKTLDDFSAKDADGCTKMVAAKSKAIDFEFLRESVAKFIMMDEKSFNTVEGPGFIQMLNAFEPRFNVPCRTTIARDCFRLYLSEKKKLAKFLRDRRLSLTTDCWTSNQTLSYMAITAHFIDDNWVLHKRILNFCQVDDHKGETIAKAIESCMLGWGLNKVLTITVDNATSNDRAIEYLKFCNWSDVVLSNKYLHVRCAAHITNLIVKEGLKEEGDCVMKIRNAVKYVRSSPPRMKKFLECIAYERIECKKGVSLDVDTRWNSSFLMLEAASKYRKAFDRLRREDTGYLFYFGGTRIGPPHDVDWDKADALLKFLELFYEATLIFSGSTHVTSSMYLSQVVEMYLIIKLYQDDSDIVLANMADSMRRKFEKYWVDSQLGNNLLFLGVIFDPRHKFKKVEFCLEQMYSDDLSSDTPTVSAKATSLIEEMKKELGCLFSFYTDAYGEHEADTVCAPSVVTSQIANPKMRLQQLMKARYQKKLEKEHSVETKCELTRYLHEATEENEDLDVLQWWKFNSVKYPILSKIAKEVLAVPVSSVASEQAFSTGGRVLSDFRSSLKPKTVEMLVCGQNWLRSTNEPFDLRVCLDYIDKYEDMTEELDKLHIVDEDV